MNSVPSTAQHSTAQHSTAQHSTAQHSTAQHSTAQHSTAQHSTAQHSTAQHSTAQPYLALDNYCCNSFFKQSFGCTQPYNFRDERLENRDKGSVLANEVLCLFRHCEQSKTAWQSTKKLPLIRGDVSYRLTERFSEQSEIDYPHHSDYCVHNKSHFSCFFALTSKNYLAFNRGAIC